MKTYAPKARDIERRWYVIDADGAVLGRLATQVARVLRGKDKPIFAPHADTGDHVVVVNARGVVLTGGKRDAKMYHHHSGYPGGLRSVDYARLLSERPSRAVERAVRGMLPKNRLGRKMLGKLSVYDGAEHPHAAQRPLPLTLGEIPRWEGLPKHELPADGQAEEAPAPTRPRARRGGGREGASEAKPRRPRAGAETKTATAVGGAAPADKAARTTGKSASEKPAPRKASAPTKPAAAKPAAAKSAAAKPGAAKAGAAKAAAAKPQAAKPATAKEPASAPGDTPDVKEKAPARPRRKKTEEES